MTEPHPMRCETCTKDSNCPVMGMIARGTKSDIPLMAAAIIITPEIGCASHSTSRSEQSIHSIEQFKKLYFPKAYEKEITDKLMERIDSGDKEAIKELAAKWVDEIFKSVDAEDLVWMTPEEEEKRRSGKQEGQP